MDLEEIIARLDEVRGRLNELAEIDELSDEEAREFDELYEEAAELRKARKEAEEEQRREERREQVRQTMRDNPTQVERPDAPNVNRGRDDEHPMDVLNRAHTLDRDQANSLLRDTARQVTEEVRFADESHREQVEQHLELRGKRGRQIAEHVIKYGNDTYRSAFSKMMSGNQALLTDEESRALVVGTNTQGGFLVPTHLDPTLILTNDGTLNPYRRISRVVTLTEGNTWNGVSTAGVTASEAGEGVEASDDTPELANPSIDVHKAHAFVPATIEAIQDMEAGAPEIVMLFQDAKERLDAQRFTTGSGSSQPTGIFTALDANTNVEVEVTTQGSIGDVDIYGLWAALPPRSRAGSGVNSPTKWLSEVTHLNSVRQLGSDDHNFTVDLTSEGIPMLFGREYVESSDANATVQSTTVDNLIVLGDFRNFVIVDRLGASVEFIPHLFGANQRPTGERGWYFYWRRGSDSVNDSAFRLLQDGT